MPYIFRIKNQNNNFTIDRELMKAYVGFNGSGLKNSKVFTGNQGAFNGSLSFKFFIQQMTATMADKQLIYVPFDIEIY